MKRYLNPSILRVAFELVLVLAVLGAVFARGLPSWAASINAPAAQDAPELTLYWYQCNGPNNHIGLFSNRVHIFCDSTTIIAGAPALSTDIHWFTVPTSSDAEAGRFMSLMQTAVVMAKPIWMQVDPSDTSGSSYGCGASNCRRIYAMEMR